MFLTKISKSILFLLLHMVSLLVLTSCVYKSNRYGIIFTADLGSDGFEGSTDIYQIKDNSQGKIEQLTFTPKIGEYQLLVSKDGEEIVFITGFIGLLDESSIKQRHIYFLNTTSKEFVDMTSTFVQYEQVWPDFSMDWSQDQKQFVVVTHEGEGLEIESFLEIINFDREKKEKIYVPIMAEIPSLIQTAKWSPDAKKLVLTQKVIGVKQKLENPGSAIIIYDLESGILTKLTDYKDNCLPVEWSPDSSQIVVECYAALPQLSEKVFGAPNIIFFDVENPDQPYQHNVFTSCYDPSWSFNGDQIALVCESENSQKGILIINSDGTGLREIKVDVWTNAAILKNPTWSPDGTQIIYIMGIDYQHTNIYSVNIDGSNNHLLTNQESSYNIVSIYPVP